MDVGTVIGQGPMQWYGRAMRRYADFTGRAHRTEFWTFTLLNLLVVGLATAADAMLGNGPGAAGVGMGLAGLYALGVLIPTTAVGTRRLHDIGRSGWWQLATLVPVAGWGLLLVFWATTGDQLPNRYGVDPRRRS